MKRDELVRSIRKAAKAQGLEFESLRQGAEHEVFVLGGVRVTIPRHREIGPKMEFEIRRALEPVLGPRWWR
jgi:hypothetical protein